MKKVQLSPRGKVILAVSAQLIIVFVIFMLRFASVQGRFRFLVCLCDGLFIGGGIFLIWGIVSWAISKGGLDGLFYICRIVSNLLTPERIMQGKPRYISYYDFVKTQERHPSNMKMYLIIGGSAFVISAVLYFAYNAVVVNLNM